MAPYGDKIRCVVFNSLKSPNKNSTMSEQILQILVTKSTSSDYLKTIKPKTLLTSASKNRQKSLIRSLPVTEGGHSGQVNSRWVQILVHGLFRSWHSKHDERQWQDSGGGSGTAVLGRAHLLIWLAARLTPTPFNWRRLQVTVVHLEKMPQALSTVFQCLPSDFPPELQRQAQAGFLIVVVEGVTVVVVWKARSCNRHCSHVQCVLLGKRAAVSREACLRGVNRTCPLKKEVIPGWGLGPGSLCAGPPWAKRRGVCSCVFWCVFWCKPGEVTSSTVALCFGRGRQQAVGEGNPWGRGAT